MADEQHQIGTMDIEAQEKTFAGFVRWVKNGIVICILILILLAITGT